MRSIVIGMAVAAGLTFAGTAPTMAAPASCAAISQATAEMSPVTQARCWCVGEVRAAIAAAGAADSPDPARDTALTRAYPGARALFGLLKSKSALAF
jgi:hypothetical protein